ncbi:transcriptional repressor LexA [Marinibaculum pumilum]|uniref:LexA repressor n=1 Tax=Marinibaculum pumilum TaxID=1766165 RepID=A0ABV7KUZ3_9PROT
MLTRKQHELLLFIHERLKVSGISPSFDEMKEALGLRSKSGIHRLITGLEERGFIRRLPHRARALEILKLPTDIVPAGRRAAPVHGAGTDGEVEGGNGFTPRLVHGGATGEVRGLPQAGAAAGAPAGTTAGSYGGLRGRGADRAPEIVELPLYGRIAAGTPIEALRDLSAQVEVPSGMLSGGGDFYALEIAGDSMVDVGILDGDTVVIRRCEDAESGTIVVALVDDNEATLKRLRRKGKTIALEAANPKYETRIFGADRVKVQGRLVGLLRSY